MCIRDRFYTMYVRLGKSLSNWHTNYRRSLIDAWGPCWQTWRSINICKLRYGKGTSLKLTKLEVRKGRWRRLGHLLRRPDDQTVKEPVSWSPQGWRRRGSRPRMTRWVFENTVKSVLHYVRETWKVSKQLTHKLQTFINRCLRTMLANMAVNQHLQPTLWERNQPEAH